MQISGYLCVYKIMMRINPLRLHMKTKTKIFVENKRMTITEYLNKQEPERKKLLSAIHKIITQTNKNAKAEIGKMMGKEMIMYYVDGAFIYALSSVKEHMSLHNMVLYGYKPVHEKYSKLFKKAKFQKGCINFKNAEEVPLEIMEAFMTDCAKAAPKYLEIYKARMEKKK